MDGLEGLLRAEEPCKACADVRFLLLFLLLLLLGLSSSARRAWRRGPWGQRWCCFKA